MIDEKARTPALVERLRAGDIGAMAEAADALASLTAPEHHAESAYCSTATRAEIAQVQPAPAGMPAVEDVADLLQVLSPIGPRCRSVAERVLALFAPLAQENERLKGEDRRLREAVSRENDDICQTLGKALGYPWFKDDQKNFPGATEDNGVCVGEHVAGSLASEAASRLAAAEARALSAEARVAQAVGRPAEVVNRIADTAAAVARQAGVGATETAGLIISVLAANPEHVDRFMEEGSELFIDGTMRPENGCLSHHAMNGQIVSPSKIREMKGQSQ